MQLVKTPWFKKWIFLYVNLVTLWPWKLSTFSRSSAGFIFQQKQEKLRNLILSWESFAQGRFQCFLSARCYHFCIWNHPFHTVRNERLFNEAECLIFHGSCSIVLQKSFQKSLLKHFQGLWNIIQIDFLRLAFNTPLSNGWL